MVATWKKLDRMSLLYFIWLCYGIDMVKNIDQIRSSMSCDVCDMDKRTVHF